MVSEKFEKDGKVYIKSYHNFNRSVDIWEVVESAPMGYVVWNIGVENSPMEGYIPFARLNDSNKYYIKRENLKCMYVGVETHKKIMEYATHQTIYAIDFDDIIKEL